MIGSTLLRGGVFLLIGVVLWVGLQSISQAHPPRGWDLILLGQMDTLRTAPESIETLVIGSSHAGAIDPAAMERSSIVLPFPWNDLAEADFQVRTLVPRLPELRLALITISYFTFHWSNDELGDDGLLDSRRTFHAVAPGWGTVDGDLASLVRGKSYWIARPDEWLGVIQGVRGEGRDEDELGAYLEEVRSDSALVNHAEERVPHTLEQKREMIERNPNLPEENSARLIGIVEYLQEAGVCVVLYTPPFHWRYHDLYRSEPTLGEMRSRTMRAAAETGVEWLDYSDHPMSDEARWFFDSDHLNTSGIERFTRMILDDAADSCEWARGPV